MQVPFGRDGAVVSRIAPAAGPELYKTYGMSMPIGSHWRPATCEEVDCDAYRCGWVSTFDLSTDLGQRQYRYCSHDRTRSFTESRAGTLVSLTYPPGMACFAAGEHKVPLGRPATFTVRDGDFRGNPRGTEIRVHTRAEDWIDDFANHQDRLATEVQKG